ncbi:MAG: hypothetical protein PF447_07110 [Spirochaetaceae bacterium]|nr:hypothetical protein [Spirochaetaceae bacterium]
MDGRFYSLGTWSWDNSVSVSIYPDYTNAGRELNSFVISTAPEYTLYIMDNSQLSLGYALDYKYYLNAQFETPTGGIDSNNRFYLIHDLNLNFETTPIKPLTLGMDYQFRYHDSYHYNLTLFGYPSNQYVEDFFDYIRNEISIYTGLSLGNYDLDIQGTWSLRDFQNYPARDSTKTFIDQLRSDTAISVKIENSYELLDNPQFGKLSIFLNGMWEQEVSNHSYEVSYLTNYENYTLSLGLQWKD